MSNVYAPPGTMVDDVQRGGGSVSAAMVESLRGTRPWVLLIGILLFIAAVFMGLGGLMMVVGMGIAGVADKGMPGGTALMVGMGALYLVSAAIYIFMGLYLMQYAGSCSRVVKDAQSADLESALDHQRKFWKLGGIMALIFVAIAVLGMIAAVAIPLMMGLGAR
ncbi:MAG: DUF5362 family protein [Burkholderiales bacterium]|nr:DUF5362 family protein [Burkholderiales bacterium]